MATPAAVEGPEQAAGHAGSGTRTLVLAALGVVYGDIGTSPLYTLKEAFGHAGGLRLSEPAVLGVLSLVFWSLVLVVTVKYVALILRADNRGEGGVLALGTLAARTVGDGRRRPASPAPDPGPYACRPVAVLRRRADHARDLGHVGGRGAR